MKLINNSLPTKFKLLGGIALLFGLLTIKEGASVLFFNGEARTAAGNFVPFVLTFNFIAGFFYVLAGASILTGFKWSTPIAVLIAATTLIIFIVFGFHIYSGSPYETRTLAAMTLRSLFWLVTAFLLRTSKYFGCPMHSKSCAN